MARDEPRQRFHHPYKPYKIQEELMLALYKCIEQSKGKSLSLICAALSWLRDHKRADFEDARDIPPNNSNGDKDEEPDWLEQHARKEHKRQIVENRKELEARLEAIRIKEDKIRKQAQHGEPAHKRRKIIVEPADLDNPEGDFLLQDYHSDDDDERSHGDNANSDGIDLGLNSETRALMSKLGMYLGPGPELLPTQHDHEPEDELKIYFCSRTHSQLSQFVGELRRVKMPSAYPTTIDDQSNTNDYPVEQVKQLTLGSRKQLCINDKVLKLSNPTVINERCLDLQGSKTSKDSRCPHLPGKENQIQTLDFQHYALAKIRDIEDLNLIGRKISICPYYATRPAIKPSEMVTLPYPMLLQRSAREALDISLTDHVVIIDEAHNLMDAILGIYTVELSLAQLQLGREQTASYLKKFRNRLLGRNRVYVTQVVRLIDSLRECLKHSEAKHPSGTILKQHDLLAGKGVDQINLHKLFKYLDKSRLARKVHGYVQHQQTLEDQPQDVTTPVLTLLGNFLMALTNPAEEGRFFHCSGSNDSDKKLKYLLLDPSEHFREVVESARSVILIGGTMSPMDDHIRQLFPYLPQEKLTTLSCGHVIPSSNLFVSHMAHSADGTELDFTFASRHNGPMLARLGTLLLAILSRTPDGAVIFFPSYAFLDHVVNIWKTVSKVGEDSIYSRLEQLKAVFLDSPSGKGAATTDATLAAYTASVLSEPADGITSRGPKGAVLLSVIGGKLSEGINFSDRLGRLVVVIGLPYPNPHAPDFKARMEYIESKAAAAAAVSTDPSGPKIGPYADASGGAGYVKGQASRDFADNLCMRAVNQAIGRAIRHKDDWAAILLIDKRYAQTRIRNKLPAWIKGSMRASPSIVTGPARRDELDLMMTDLALFNERMGCLR